VTCIAARVTPKNRVRWASDSQVSSDGLVIVDAIPKIRMFEFWGPVGGAGEVNALEAIYDLFTTETNLNRLLGSIRQYKFEGYSALLFYRLDCGFGLVDSSGAYVRPASPFWAFGSGNELAIGAMASGASARKSVEIACTYREDCCAPVREVEYDHALGRITFAR